MTGDYQWPAEIPIPGGVMGQMQSVLGGDVRGGSVEVARETLRHWLQCMEQMTALLDPEHPKVTREAFVKFRVGKRKKGEKRT